MTRPVPGVVRWFLPVVAATMTLVWNVPLAPIASATTSAPYTDPDAQGYIGLCNQQGVQVTSGNVDAKPFASRAVSTKAAVAPYSSSFGTATLYGFLPMQELSPGDWSGQQLTATSHYSNPSHPMAEATAADESLSTLIAAYPPEWDGFYELRIYLGAANEAPYEAKYPVLNLQVKGHNWYAIGGGAVDCHAGTAQSIESILLPKSETSPTTLGSQSAGASGRRAAGDGEITGSADSTAAGGYSGGEPASDAQLAKDNGLGRTTKSSSNPGVVIGAVVAGVVVVAAALVALRRRRIGAHSVPQSSSTS